MENTKAETLEDVLQNRLGLTVEDAIATGTDIVDEQVARSADRGVQFDQRLDGLGDLLERLSRPETLTAIATLLDSLPQLVEMLRVAQQLPNLLATLGDVVDDTQQRCAAEGMDIEKAIINGCQAAMWLGTKVDQAHLRRLGDLLGSEIMNVNALNVVDNAARSLNTAQQQSQPQQPPKLGLLGLLKAMRDPEIQRSLDFAIHFGKSFGQNLKQSTQAENRSQA